MSNFGFGMHSGDDDDRDDDQNNNGGNPFEFLFGGRGGGNPMGGGDLGDILNQFGAMISGFGTDLNGNGDKSPVNYQMVERIARQHINAGGNSGANFSAGLFGFGGGARQSTKKNPSTGESQAVAESVRLAELWLDEATVLPAGATGSVAFGAEQWFEETFATWKRIFTPLADKLGEAAMSEMPEEMKQQLGPMGGILKQVNAMNFSMQLGHTLGELALSVVHSTQWGMPLAKGSTAAVANEHLADLAEKLGTNRQETLIYLASREAAHLRLFQHVPWLRERLILDVEEFAKGLTLDTSAMEEATREFNPEMLNDPAKLQEMMNSLQGEDLAPKVVSSNAHARERLETSLSLVEGWVDFVVGNALSSRMPNASMLNAGWSSFRDNDSPAMAALTKSVGISLTAPRANDAADLWYRLDEAVGKEKRDGIWDHPDLLPMAEDLDNPAGFIGRVGFDGDEMADFDPIGEIEKLEAEMRKKEQGGEGNDAGNDAAAGEDSSNEDNDG